MPFYDQKCTSCEWTKENVLLRVSEKMLCPSCNSETEHYWSQSHRHAVIQDEFSEPLGFTPYDSYLMKNGRTSEATVMHSHSERRRIMNERGLREAIDHVGMPGSDKAPHTTSWASGPPPGVDPRPSCMLTPEEQAIRHAEWLKTEPVDAAPIKETAEIVRPDTSETTSFAKTISELLN